MQRLESLRSNVVLLNPVKDISETCQFMTGNLEIYNVIDESSNIMI